MGAAVFFSTERRSVGFLEKTWELYGIGKHGTGDMGPLISTVQYGKNGLDLNATFHHDFPYWTWSFGNS